MAESIKQLRERIRSIENTKKITNAMRMVSSAKYKRVEAQLFATRAYYTRLNDIFSHLLAASMEKRHAFFHSHDSNAPSLVCVITSDSGLCGTYNNNSIRHVESFIHTDLQNHDVQILPVGKKAFQYFSKKNYTIVSPIVDTHGRYSDALMQKILFACTTPFTSNTVRDVYIAYTEFVGQMRYVPRIEKLFPMEPTTKESADYIAEPNIGTIMETLVPIYCAAKLRSMLFESFTAEHSSRTVTMTMATDNAKDLLETFILQMNKTRQASITREVIEIISSAEALKG